MMRRLTRLMMLVGIAGVCSIGARAQFLDNQNLREQAQAVINNVYNMNFDRADSFLVVLENTYPSDPAVYFLRGFNRYWQTYFSPKTERYLTFIDEQLEKSLTLNKAFEKQPGSEKSYYFLQFMIYAIKAKIHNLREEDLRAANAGRKMLPYLKKGFSLASESREFAFSSGLYHYYAEAYPRDHVYLKPFMIFFPKGDLELGLKELEMAGYQENLAQAEALYYLSEIYVHDEDEGQKGLASARKLHRLFPRNTWFHADYIRALIYNKQYPLAGKETDQLITAFERISGHDARNITSLTSRFTSYLMVRIYHYKGQVVLLHENKPEEAIAYFRKSMHQAQLGKINRFEYLPDDMYHIGLCYDRLGKREEAVDAYTQAIKMPDSEKIKKKAQACRKNPCQ